MTTPPIVLTIAGTDPSGGAGIQADIKSISATGSYAASVITALVAQNTCGVRAIQEVSPAFITQQLDAVFDDLTVHAVKIGMLHDSAVIQLVAQALLKYAPPYVVLDPVMVAKDGSLLLNLNTIDTLKRTFRGLTTLLTPNLTEAETLLARTIRSRDAMQEAAFDLSTQFECAILIKGGHLDEPSAPDILLDDTTGLTHWFEAPRVSTRNTHGTGCSLSSAIASYLAQGKSLKDAVAQAKHYLTQAILAGRHQVIGRGAGPVNHFYFLSSAVNTCQQADKVLT